MMASSGFEQLLSYLKPGSTYAAIIIYCLATLFILWLALVVWLVWRVSRFRRRIRLTQDLRLLSDSVSDGSADADSLAVFDHFLTTQSLTQSHLVAKHIQLLYTAGRQGRDINGEDICRQTLERLFQMNPLVLRVLSIFIVVGLFGTLIGLAHSLGSLSPSLLDDSLLTARTALEERLRELFICLKNAFAPSIWGVGLTIVGVIISELYMRLVCGPTKIELIETTTRVWLPQLHQESETYERREAERKQAERHATSLSDTATRFKESAQSIDDACEKLVAFSSSFEGASNKILSFREELEKLFGVVVNDSKAIREALDNYNKEFLAQRRKREDSVSRFLEQATRSIEGLGRASDKNIELTQQRLESSLSTIRVTLEQQLSGISANFASFDVPMKSVAKDIVGVLESVVKRTETLCGQLHSEFMEGCKERRQIAGDLGDVSKNIEKFVRDSESLYDIHGTQVMELASAVHELNVGVTDLHSSIGGLVERLQESLEGVRQNQEDSEQWSAQAVGLKVSLRDLKQAIERLSGSDGAADSDGGRPVLKLVRVDESTLAPVRDDAGERRSVGALIRTWFKGQR